MSEDHDGDARVPRVQPEALNRRRSQLGVDRILEPAAAATVNDPDLQVPHRELPNRDFWQRELAELAVILSEAKDPHDVILSEAKDPFHKGES